MKIDLKFKAIFGISALSLASGFYVSGAEPYFGNKEVGSKISYEETVEKKLENTKNKEVLKSKRILPKIEKILKAVPKLIISYSISAIASLFTIYITDKVSVKLLDVKATDYFRDLLK